MNIHSFAQNKKCVKINNINIYVKLPRSWLPHHISYDIEKNLVSSSLYNTLEGVLYLHGLSAYDKSISILSLGS